MAGQWSLLVFPSVPESDSSALSAALTRSLTQSFGDRTGAGVAAEVSSGKILAAKNLALAGHRLALPGSTLKTFVLYELLESGKLRPEETFVCPIRLMIGSHRLDCLHPPDVGPLAPAKALAWSCNNFFAQMALRLGLEELARALARWGFTAPTHLVEEEVTGKIATANTKSALQLQGLGEFGIHVTPLELLQAFRRLAKLRREAVAPEPPAGITFAGLADGVEYGMAAAAKTPGLPVAGKTGTSLADEGSWTHGWFAGYAPADAPEIVLVVFLERGRGPTDAAGIAHELFSVYRDARGSL